MSDDLNAEELLRRCKEIDFQLARNERLAEALQEIADSRLFNSYDPADCTEEVFEEGRALIQTARDAVSRDNA